MMPIRRWPAEVLVAPIRFYQRFITPYTPATCRYYPTCSAYAVTALRHRGAVVGTVLTIWRLLRCNPWSAGGIDHVPAVGLRLVRQDAVESSSGRERDEPDGSSIDGSIDVDGETGSVARSTSDPLASAPAAGNPADLPSAPPSRGGASRIGRFAA